MTDSQEQIQILRVTDQSSTTVEDTIVGEFPMTIMLNDQELVTMLCTPSDLKYLAVGFLFSEGFIESKDDIRQVTVNQGTGVVRVDTEPIEGMDREALFSRIITSGCGRGASFYSTTDLSGEKVQSLTRIAVASILALTSEFQHRSETYRATGGVHSAALCDKRNILTFSEDIGRHNAMDKVFGECLMKDTPTDDRVVVTSGRISSEILLKVARRKVPILISKSAPTSLAVKLANDLGITLVGFVRGKRANVYTNTWRVTATGD